MNIAAPPATQPTARRSRLQIVFDLMTRAPFAALATQSHSQGGFPFVSAVPFLARLQGAAYGDMIFLLSDLAEHSKNLRANAAASLLLIAPEAARDSDVEAGERASWVGQCHVIADDAADRAEIEAAWLARHPAAAQYLQLDFRFYRLRPERIRVIGGFGQASWLEAERLRVEFGAQAQ